MNNKLSEIRSIVLVSLVERFELRLDLSQGAKMSQCEVQSDT
jgi:hypothetical protein